MKTIGVILFVSLVLAANLRDAEARRMSFEEIKETMQPLKKLCIERVGTDPKLIDEANKGNFTPDRKLQCYYKCLLVMTKVMTKDDEIVPEAFVQTAELMLLEEYVQPVIDAMSKCAPIALEKKEGCQKAYDIAKCYYEQAPTLGLYP